MVRVGAGKGCVPGPYSNINPTVKSIQVISRLLIVYSVRMVSCVIVSVSSSRSAAVSDLKAGTEFWQFTTCGFLH